MNTPKRWRDIAVAQPFAGGILGLLLGAVLGWLLGGMCITFMSENSPEEERVVVSFFPMFQSAQEVDAGDGQGKMLVVNKPVTEVRITKPGCSDLASQVQITFFVLRALLGGLLGASIGLLFDVHRHRQESAISATTAQCVQNELVEIQPE